MRVHSIRLGPATNSSSTHSLVFLSEPAHDDLEGINDCNFGWEHFTLTSKSSKKCYLAIMLYDELIRVLPEKLAKTICRKWVGTPPKDGYVDHQSVFAFPSDFHYNIPDEDFVKELHQLFMRENLAVLGGNDNTSSSHELAQGNFRLPFCDIYGDLTCRKDPSGYWVVFSRKSGNKIRFSFEDGDVRKPEKSFAPELVDVKITNWCSSNCEFCYQDSDQKGRHAEYHHVSNLAEELGRLKVFEVAIGGGEPTSHPDFEMILESFRVNGVVPNFSTRSLDWLRNPSRWRPIIDKCGAFALSVSLPKEVKELVSLLTTNGIDSSKAGLHVIPEITYFDHFEEILEEASKNQLRVTLLGYKPVGRGKDFDLSKFGKKDPGWWMKKLRNRWEVGIDTSLAKKFEKQLKESDVPRLMYETEEGKFSCYIDAVSQTMGPSSYCDPSEMVPLKLSYEIRDSDDITDVFARF